MRTLKLTVNGIAYRVEVQEEGIVAAPFVERVRSFAGEAAIPLAPPPVSELIKAPPSNPVAAATGDTIVNAPMPGKVTKVVIKEGQKVKKGDVLMFLEAMKMQNEIGSPADGTVKSINVKSGDSVKPGQLMLVLS
ncbi:MAG: biotin/lipoyl-containing protein [Negativicutes bacterium]